MKQFRIVKLTHSRIMTAAISIILMIFIIATNFVPAGAVQNDITIKSPGSVDIGHSFDVVLSANSNFNIKAINFYIEYNDEYVSFKSIKTSQSGEVNTNNNNGRVDIIILFDDTFLYGDTITLTFTAKNGTNSSNQIISFEIVEAVDKNMNDVYVKIPSSTNVEIVKKSEQNSKDENNSNIRGSVSSKYSSSSVKSKVTSSVNMSSKTNNSKNYGISSGNVSSKSVGDVSEKDNKGAKSTKTENSVNNTDNATSISQFYSSESVGNLNLTDSKGKYIFVGIGGTLSVIGILFAVYRLGQLSRRKPESDKIFKKDNKKNKW